VSRRFVKDVTGRNARSLGANLGFIVLREKPALIVLHQHDHPLRRSLRFPIWEPAPQSIHFPLDLIPRPTILWRHSGYLQDNQRSLTT
jgi:hypothetical protein